MDTLRLVLKIIAAIFFACLFLAALLAGLEAVWKVPLADFLVRKLSDIMMLCVGAIAGLLAGRQLERRERKRTQQPAE